MNLKEFLNKYGTNTSNNFQLLHWGRQLGIKNFHVLMRDEIDGFTASVSQKKHLPLNIIVNIDPKRKNGSHWSAFYIGLDSKNGSASASQKYWYDSFGLPPLKEIIDKFHSPIIGEDKQFQDFGETRCGQLALFVLYRLNQGDKYEDIVKNIN